MDNTKIFAHRGVSSQFPENTMASFNAAHQLGADGIEFDVQLSKDGVPVVIHDLTLDRTTSGSGNVREYSLNELERLSAGSWFGQLFISEKIPTLEEVLNRFKHSSILLNIELKGYADDRAQLVEKVVSLVLKYKMEQQVIFSSFDHIIVQSLQREVPFITAAILVRASLIEPLTYLKKVGCKGFHFYHTSMLEHEVNDLKKAGIQVRTYTVNDPMQVRNYIIWGCAGIFTDDPEMALGIRKEMKKGV